MVGRNTKKKKPIGVAGLKSRVWESFSLYIRLRDATAWADRNPEYNGPPAALCITCKRFYPATGVGCLQAGHFIPGRKNEYLFDEVQVNAQCYGCNVKKNGNWAEYYLVMIERHGQEAVNEMINRKQIIKSFTVQELEELLAHYKAKAAGLT